MPEKWTYVDLLETEKKAVVFYLQGLNFLYAAERQNIHERKVISPTD